MAPPPLLASYYTLSGTRPFEGPMGPSPIPLRRRIEAAAKAGYKGIGVDYFDLLASIETYGHDGIRAMLDDNGLLHFEVDGMGDWYASGPARSDSDTVRSLLLTAAEKIGFTQLRVTGNMFGRSYPVDVMRAEFARLCHQAADAGTRLSLEILNISDVRDVRTALAIVGDTVPGNGGVIIDIWHFARDQQSYDTIGDLSGGAIAWVEIDDGAATPQGSIISEGLDDRLLPGDGTFDIAGFLAAARAAGYAGPIGVEVISNELRRVTVEEAADLTFRKASLQFSDDTWN